MESKLRIALVAPHIFTADQYSVEVIFSPGDLVRDLGRELSALGHELTLFSPGKVEAPHAVWWPKFSGLERELQNRGYGLDELLRRSQLAFVSLARQLQSSVVAEAYRRANNGEFDLVHVFMNEEETALAFAHACAVPVVFTHHDPFNLYPRYRTMMPEYKHLPWISISMAQRQTAPKGTNWLANVYHGLPPEKFSPAPRTSRNSTGQKKPLPYVAYLGRIIESKGVHLAIAAAKQAGIKLKIAGKYYGKGAKARYWEEQIEPQLQQDSVEYEGFITTASAKREFLANAQALVMPSAFSEPFGMVAIEALACGTPVIGTKIGAIPEIISTENLGKLVEINLDKFSVTNTNQVIDQLAEALTHQALAQYDSRVIRFEFLERFTSRKMAKGYVNAYGQALKHN